jgi:hypothetical protein
MWPSGSCPKAMAMAIILSGPLHRRKRFAAKKQGHSAQIPRNRPNGDESLSITKLSCVHDAAFHDSRCGQK